MSSILDLGIQKKKVWAVVMNRDRGLVEVFVTVAHPRGRAGGMSTEIIVMLVLEFLGIQF